VRGDSPNAAYFLLNPENIHVGRISRPAECDKPIKAVFEKIKLLGAHAPRRLWRPLHMITIVAVVQKTCGTSRDGIAASEVVPMLKNPGSVPEKPL
jgi:hypothetical protein